MEIKVYSPYPPQKVNLNGKKISFAKDGHYIIDHIIIPSINCVQSNVNPQNYDFIYATDGVNFFKLVENSFEECSILELTEINSDLKTTISKASQETFSLCLLNNKFLELSKQ